MLYSLKGDSTVTIQEGLAHKSLHSNGVGQVVEKVITVGDGPMEEVKVGGVIVFPEEMSLPMINDGIIPP